MTRPLDTDAPSPYCIMTKNLFREAGHAAMIVVGILLAGLGLKGFLLSSGFIDGGVTVFKGRRGMSGAEQDILFCVVTRLEIGRVKTAVRDLDESAFVVVYPLSDAQGGVIKKSALH